MELPQAAAEEVQGDIVHLFKTAEPSKPNLTWEGRVALRAIRKDESLVILKADKGKASVIVVTQEDYYKKLQEVLNDRAFRRIIKTRQLKLKGQSLNYSNLQNGETRLNHYLHLDPLLPLKFMGYPRFIKVVAR